MSHTEIAVVGAGPVGLTAALAMARNGFSVAVYEQLAEPSTAWRASTFMPPTVEIAAHLGIADQMLQAGIVAPRYQVRDRRDGLIAEFDLGVLADETDYPFRLQLEQYKYTQILRDALTDEHPEVAINFASGVENVAQDGDGVRLVLPGGATATADWALAADGARSTVRKSLGCAFTGLTYEHRYLALSVDYPIDTLLPGICDVNYVADPAEHLLLLRVPDVWRVVVSVPPTVTSEQALSDEYVGERLAGLFDGRRDLPLLGRQVYGIHQRVVDTFRREKIMLLGDAAHINSPMGGMGLNGGIHDAFDLSVQLTAVIADGADPALLDQWADRRRRAAVESVQEITHRTTTAMAEQDEQERQAFQQQMSELADDPASAKSWLMDAAMISNVRKYSLPDRSSAAAAAVPVAPRSG